MTFPAPVRWPDIQRLLTAAFTDLVGAGHAGTETPYDLAGRLPFLRVRRVGGRSDDLNDYSTVAVDAFDVLYDDVQLLAETVRQYLCGPPPAIPMLDRADCESGPAELPWDTPGQTIRRVGATYQVVTRRRRL